MLPIRTSVICRRTPYVNYGLIVINALIFLMSYHHPDRMRNYLYQWAQPLVLDPSNSHLWQFVTYAFLHAGWMHIFGNMFFLYIFGAAVNDRLGNVGYLCFYLAGAVVSGIGHVMLSGGASCLGASGAVAAVTGAYLVLFPQSLVTVVYWFIFIGTIELPALYFIALKLILLDNIIATGTPNIAYEAHLAGYLFGFVAIMALLATRLLNSGNFDLWTMIQLANRRRKWRGSMSKGNSDGKNAKWVKVKQAKKTPSQIKIETQVDQLKQDITERMSQRNLGQAANLYLELVKVDPSQVLPSRYLLDIANQLASVSQHNDAAMAYEQYLEFYKNSPNSEQVELMLGLLCSRYLNRPDDACHHLKRAAKKITDPSQLKMCNDEIDKIS